MNIKTADGVTIYCLPDNALCKECGKHPSDIDECPAKNFDTLGLECIPELCEEYTEESEERYTVTEMCPHCETEVEMRWDVKQDGFKAYCPYCGERLMLCDACQHRSGEHCDDCDYDTNTDSCRFNLTLKRK